MPYRMAAPVVPFPPTVFGYPFHMEEEVVRRFLREVGLPEDSIRGSRSELVSYLRGRLGL